MRIDIDPCAANEPDAHRWLDRILHMIEDGWHLWDTTGHLDSSEFEATTWVKDGRNNGNDILELFRKSNEREAWNSGLHTKRIHVTTDPSNEHELNPEDAARFVEQPLCILVENEFSDGLFLKRIVDVLDESLSNHWNQSPKSIQIDSVGGVPEMPKAIKQRSDQRSVRLRLFAIADSDKKCPSDQEGKGAQELRKACDDHNIPCWILAKRAAENYLPSIILKKMKPNDQEYILAVDAWERLSDDQKNFFNMKKGLPEDRDDDEYPLFEGVPEADYIVLRRGFGRKIYKCWEYADAKVKSELRTRSQGDLEYGIELIRKEV